MTVNRKITETDYAKWLEQVLRDIVKLPVKGITIAAVLDSGDTYLDYYNVSMNDKLIVSGLIQQDAMIDNLAAMGVIEYAEEDETDGEEETE